MPSTNNDMSPTVFIVDDDYAVLDSLKLLMMAEVLPCAAFTSAQEFLDNYEPGQPGCLVLDVGMPGMSGIQLQRELTKKAFDLPIIFITGHGDVPMAVRAIQEGAVDFLQKPFRNEDLLKRIARAFDKQPARRKTDRHLQDDSATTVGSDSRDGDLNTLTIREQEVLSCIVNGHSNKVTARKLNISQRTVESHRANIMQKLRVHSTAELVKLALVGSS